MTTEPGRQDPDTNAPYPTQSALPQTQPKQKNCTSKQVHAPHFRNFVFLGVLGVAHLRVEEEEEEKEAAAAAAAEEEEEEEEA